MQTDHLPHLRKDHMGRMRPAHRRREAERSVLAVVRRKAHPGRGRRGHGAARRILRPTLRALTPTPADRRHARIEKRNPSCAHASPAPSAASRHGRAAASTSRTHCTACPKSTAAPASDPRRGIRSAMTPEGPNADSPGPRIGRIIPGYAIPVVDERAVRAAGNPVPDGRSDVRDGLLHRLTLSLCGICLTLHARHCGRGSRRGHR